MRFWREYRRSSRRGWWWLLLLIPLFFIAGFVVWAVWTPRPLPEAQWALSAPVASDGVVVTTDRWLAFRPQAEVPSTGLILYPGGRVPPASYGPAAREIAAEGHLVIIVPMPLNLAFFGPQRAAAVIDAYPEIADWAVGGHSLGGAMAARFAHRNPSAVHGLVLWASYPADSDDLSEYDLAVSTIFGTLDGLATPDRIAASRPLLPLTTVWVPVEGGNRAQFGWYGAQRGDNSPAISRATQQRELTAATLALLQRVGR